MDKQMEDFILRKSACYKCMDVHLRSSDVAIHQSTPNYPCYDNYIKTSRIANARHQENKPCAKSFYKVNIITLD